jgi:hypothetical protein
VSIGDEFADCGQEEQTNPFTNYITSTNLQSQIKSKSFSSNQDISTTSMEILDQVNAVATNDLGLF